MEGRNLQSSPIMSDQIPNPVYCIKEQDNFLFTITDPMHYPKYMKNSVMNTNMQFDDGAFYGLEDEMLRN